MKYSVLIFLLGSMLFFSCKVKQRYSAHDLKGEYTGVHEYQEPDDGGFYIGSRRPASITGTTLISDQINVRLFADNTYQEIHHRNNVDDPLNYYGRWLVSGDSILLTAQGSFNKSGRTPFQAAFVLDAPFVPAYLTSLKILSTSALLIDYGPTSTAVKLESRIKIALSNH